MRINFQNSLESDIILKVMRLIFKYLHAYLGYVS